MAVLCTKTMVAGVLGVTALLLAISTITLAVLYSDSQKSLSAADDETTELPTTGQSADTTTDSSKPQIDYRLPTSVKPERYELELYPKLGVGSFEGIIDILVVVSEPLDTIILHSKGLTINHVDVKDESGSAVALSDEPYKLEQDREFLVVQLKNEIAAGKFTLNIRFGGSLLDRIVGFYQSSYLGEDAQPKTIATSKFEPTYARQAFPCFDEPAMKAKFKISLVKPSTEQYIALSNMNELSRETNGDLTTVHFSESVPMSTYLACFIVCDFKSTQQEINAMYGDNFLLSVYATPAQLSKTVYAKETAVKVIEHYIEYFKIPYPLPKLDMAAIPDFVSGAMEHWGLVTYRETALLYDPAISSTSNKQRVASVIGHELAHMWFGNLVTMAWWNELWLNEGFASYMEFKGVAAAEPSWEIMDQFLPGELHPVLNLDATFGSHPIVQKVSNPDQITEIFDTITYNKGASVIRMLEDFVGEEIFQQGVTAYLEKFKYSNAETLDLLVELQSIVGDSIDVKYIIATWTQQMGFPVVNVKRGRNAGEYVLEQKRFLADPDNEGKGEPSPFNYRWTIPITYRTEKSKDVKREWFPDLDNELPLAIDDGSSWVKFNHHQIGYYRVNYPADLWNALSNQLVTDYKVFDTSDRAHLLEDAFSLAEASQLDYSTALGMTKYLVEETEYVPWTVATSKLSSLKSLLYLTDDYPNLKSYCKNLVDSAYKSVGWTVSETEAHTKKLLRSDILSFACSMGHEECLNAAGQEFTKWLQNPVVRPHPDLRSIVYYSGMSSVGGEKEWNIVWDQFKKEGDANEKAKLMNALSAVKDISILSRYLELAYDEGNVRGQDYFTCVAQISSNPLGTALVWDYVRDNWQKLVDRFGLNERYLGRMIPSITKSFATPFKHEEMVAFFTKYPEAGAGTAARKQALETVANNIKWLKTNKAGVGKWLQEHV